MTRVIMTLMLVAGAAALAGCASTSYTTGRSLDTAHMAAVNEAAVRTGVRVFWVNPPEKTTR